MAETANQFPEVNGAGDNTPAPAAPQAPEASKTKPAKVDRGVKKSFGKTKFFVKG